MKQTWSVQWSRRLLVGGSVIATRSFLPRQKPDATLARPPKRRPRAVVALQIAWHIASCGSCTFRVPAKLELHISVLVNIGSHCTLPSFCKGHARTLGFFMPQDPHLKHYSANWAHFHSYLHVKVAWLLQLKKPEPYIANFQRIFLVYNCPDAWKNSASDRHAVQHSWAGHACSLLYSVSYKYY